jgi:hypothetical protein
MMKFESLLMTSVQNNYRWEAEKADGTIVTEGGDLTGCVRFSLVPQVPGLVRHDIVGVPMVRRFGRGFIRVMGDSPPEYLHCLVCPGYRLYVRSSDGGAMITPEDHEVYL